MKLRSSALLITDYSYGSVKWMTPLPSKRQSIASSPYITATPLIPHIQLTVEVPNNNGPIPFLDTLVTPGPEYILLTSVYRKPTHTDQYLIQTDITTHLLNTVPLTP